MVFYFIQYPFNYILNPKPTCITIFLESLSLITSFKLCVNRPKRKVPPLKFNETPPAIAVSKLFTSFSFEVLLSDSIFSETLKPNCGPASKLITLPRCYFAKIGTLT